MFGYAIGAQENSYAPYSGFHVGCVVKDDAGLLHTGCNVENASYSATICAERVAITKMISEGGNQIKTVLLASPTEIPVFPCGICLQTIQEFGPQAEIISVNSLGSLFKKASMKELNPSSFSTEQLRLNNNGDVF